MMSNMHVEIWHTDISPLFTNVPVGEAVTVTCERLQEDKRLMGKTPLSSDWILQVYFEYLER